MSYSTETAPPFHMSATRPANLAVTGPQKNISPLPAVGPTAFRVNLNQQLRLDANRSYLLHVNAVSVPYSAPNVGGVADQIPSYPAGNNYLSYQLGAGPVRVFTIPTGLYDLNSLQLMVNQLAYSVGDTANPVTAPMVTFTAQESTQKVLVNNTTATALTLFLTNPASTLALLLGLGNVDQTIAAGATYQGPNRGDLAIYSAIQVFCSLVLNSYANGTPGPLIATIPLGGYSPNSYIAYAPNFPISNQVNNTTIVPYIDFWLTEQNSLPLPDIMDDWTVDISISPFGPPLRQIDPTNGNHSGYLLYNQKNVR